ncbi:tRNA pseudouridine(13) synthase TruD [Geobacter sp. DSM 9736]|uniref:tRNA pseudouridine(13) synthase TruD n=1 Tax=Geobacter sp. DSM 9736 TaxID=1277350 RepID=UPI000B505159|nr:tRNA pseudouridine(13) synthase TruD [Geobacter sp. DSM 9736]
MRDYITSHIPGTGGAIKEIPEDFVVTEVPSYLPCGEGEHVYVEIEKRGLTTFEAIRRLGAAMQVSEREIGYAGLKDARGVTRQTISVPRVAPQRLLELELSGMKVLSARPHRNKLKPGHLVGNHFALRVRGVSEGALDNATRVLEILKTRGVPNYFGVQRYGSQGNSHVVGRALLLGDWKGAVDALIGEPEAVRDERWRSAVEAYRRGDLDESLRLFPGHCRTERDLVRRLLERPERFDRAIKALNPRLKSLFLSAWQSSLFDRLLDRRLDRYDQVLTGDLAFRHDNGACFLVEDEAVEAPRALRLEISPSGPMFGSRMSHPSGFPRELEDGLLKEEGFGDDAFLREGGSHLQGERRPLRVPLGEPQVEAEEDSILLRFFLPRGAYATSVLREVMKPVEDSTIAAAG